MPKFVPPAFLYALIAIAFGVCAFLVAYLDRPLVAFAIGGIMLGAHWLTQRGTR
jgi:hypothetical protein